ncbi:hypothetical protein PSN45_004325 [Yamadazyma tenuis]|uniref:MFS general substrate transporter n=1 Tax=Candida tenuis (strain ATCC 10573 / BCRC 21748 / CBS 615 / JCM 9827 / NBRC 10315 / NRRL Y-1498 / VKM Y-70) TaxID=590646 RepID=G3B666_CANTC|nr:uncharacterized protein CANTEDRAFT_114708 [Yamadazyma tenuis ATCC 10573]EGV63395.1 hypothetical protein CANTEDRAFT_114708 [Yamadazyma tenuis ATCC 10573]WEJ96782.1 hypothetical protein PSN45_004325 [Yamadazyma tenuis]
MFYYEASTKRRFIQCACAILWCLLAGGPIFGFAALKPVLIREGVYESVCDIQTDAVRGMFDFEAPQSLTSLLLGQAVGVQEEQTVAKCVAQDLKLNMMFTVGAVVTNVSALVIGKLLDDFGPRFCGSVGAFFLFLACFVFIFASQIDKSFIGPYFDPYLVGYASMALGGPFSYISQFQLSNSFPKKSGTVLALLTGAFDASSAVFLVYRIFYNRSNGVFTINKFFQCYILVPVFIAVCQVFVMEKDSYKTPPETDLCVDDVPDGLASSAAPISETDPLLNGENHPVGHHRRDSIGDALKQPYAEEGEANLVKYSGGIFGILHGYSAQYQLRTPWFYLMCLFATIQMLRLNYFVATISTQYTYLLSSVALSEKLVKFFDVALPLGGVLSIPFVGLFLDSCSTVTVLAGLLGISLIIGALGLTTHYVTLFINVCLFVVYRPFFYTSVSDFCAKVFGFDTFGTVYGAIICTSGIINFSQSVLDKWTHTTFKMNPTPINVILVVLTALIGGVNVAYVNAETELYKKRKQAQLSQASA